MYWSEACIDGNGILMKIVKQRTNKPKCGRHYLLKHIICERKASNWAKFEIKWKGWSVRVLVAVSNAEFSIKASE